MFHGLYYRNLTYLPLTTKTSLPTKSILEGEIWSLLSPDPVTARNAVAARASQAGRRQTPERQLTSPALDGHQERPRGARTPQKRACAQLRGKATYAASLGSPSGQASCLERPCCEHTKAGHLMGAPQTDTERPHHGRLPQVTTLMPSLVSTYTHYGLHP